jgi:NADH-quinone oxidoreductase subunit H
MDFADEALRALGLVAGALLLLPIVAWLDHRLRPPGPSSTKRARSSSIADALKLLGKRAARQEGADRVVHAAAPVLAIVPAATLLALVPLSSAEGPRSGTLLFALSLPFVSTTAVALAGYAGANRLALLGALRSAILRASAFVVVGGGALGAAKAAESLVLDDVVRAQARPLAGAVPGWGLLTSPLGFAVAVTALAALSQHAARARAEGEIDLVDPWSVEAAGPILLGHRVFESLELLALSAFLATLFLGGWLVPGLDGAPAALGPLVVVVKTLLVTALVLAVRRALPPLDAARAVRLCWTALVPLAAFGLVLADVVGAIFGG